MGCVNSVQIRKPNVFESTYCLQKKNSSVCVDVDTYCGNPIIVMTTYSSQVLPGTNRDPDSVRKDLLKTIIQKILKNDPKINVFHPMYTKSSKKDIEVYRSIGFEIVTFQTTYVDMQVILRNLLEQII